MLWPFPLKISHYPNGGTRAFCTIAFLGPAGGAADWARPYALLCLRSGSPGDGRAGHPHPLEAENEALTGAVRIARDLVSWRRRRGSAGGRAGSRSGRAVDTLDPGHGPVFGRRPPI